MEKSCRICGSTKRITDEHEIICVCGVVCDTIEQADTGPAYDTANLGSKNLIDPKLKLQHVNKTKTSQIIQHNNQYLNNFVACCNVLNLNDITTRSATLIFRKLLPKKLGTGKTAAFAIHQACIDSGAICNGDEIIQTVRARFNLKRYFNMREAIYAIKPTAQDMNLVNTIQIPDNYYIRKHVEPKYHHTAVKLMNVFTGKAEKRAKTIQEYLSSLG